MPSHFHGRPESGEGTFRLLRFSASSDEFLNAVGTPSPFRAPQDDETALIIYTSGTTGDPKGVEITLYNLSHEIRGVVESMELSENHRILSVLPFSHVLPLVANGLGPLCIGAAVVFLSSISPQRIVSRFTSTITFFVCVPQFLRPSQRIFSQVQRNLHCSKDLWVLFRIAGRLPGRSSDGSSLARFTAPSVRN
jgi:long-chain acyl-CoA synthetase